MIAVTERAAQELKEILAANATGPDQVLRLTADASGFSLTLDVEREGDDVVESEGSPVLLLGTELGPFVAGASIDLVDTAEGPRLTISREEPTEEEQA